MFKRMEVAEQVYAGVTPFKTSTRVESNCYGHVRKRKGGEADSPTNLEKGRAGKRKKKSAGRPRNVPTRAKMYACCMSTDTPQRSVKY